MPFVVNGWTILYGDEFGRRYTELRAEVRRLQKTLSPEEYRRHPTVKLAAGVYRLVNEIVPADPDAPDFRLGRDLSQYRRAKGFSLLPRYRLFWVFSSQAKTIVFLYLNDEETLRKEGATTDPYEVFRRMVAAGNIGKDFDANYRAWQARHETSPQSERIDRLSRTQPSARPVTGGEPARSKRATRPERSLRRPGKAPPRT